MGECCSDGVTTTAAAVMVVVSMVVVVVSAGMVAAPAPPRNQDSRFTSESILLSRYPGQEEFKSEYCFLSPFMFFSVYLSPFNFVPQKMGVLQAHNIYKCYSGRVTQKGRLLDPVASLEFQVADKVLFKLMHKLKFYDTLVPCSCKAVAMHYLDPTPFSLLIFSPALIESCTHKGNGNNGECFAGCAHAVKITANWINIFFFFNSKF